MFTVNLQVEHTDANNVVMSLVNSLSSDINLSLSKLTNLTTNQVVYSGSNDNHQTSYAFDEHWVNMEGVTSSMRLTLVVNLDHDGTTSSKSVDFVAAQ
jgi:hypothetical protein